MKNKYLSFFCLIIINLAFQTLRAGGTYTVTNTSNSGSGSLRQAIADVNADITATAASPAVIEFSFSSGSAPFIIVLTSALPSIDRPVNINGYQGTAAGTPGAIGTRSLKTVISQSTSNNIFVINSTDVTIQGLVLQSGPNAIPAAGIGDFSNLKIQGCYFNTNATGDSTTTNSSAVYPAIYLNSSIASGVSLSNNIFIGYDGSGTAANEANLINSEIGYGIRLNNTGTTTIKNNYIGGISSTGSAIFKYASFPGEFYGIYFDLIPTSGFNYTISNNFIGNLGGGIKCNYAIKNLNVYNNSIGICPDGKTTAGISGSCIEIPIGDSLLIRKNVVGNCGINGFVFGISRSTVDSNFIGMYRSGSIPMPLAGSGCVFINNSGFNEFCDNFIGNAHYNIGLVITGSSNNYIGIRRDSVTAGPNYFGLGIDKVTNYSNAHGIYITYFSTTSSTSRNYIANNIVANSSQNGILIIGPTADSTLLINNKIGTLEDGVTPAPNSNFGVQIYNSGNNKIQRNTIRFNRNIGLYLGTHDDLIGSDTNLNAADGNIISDNLATGIYLEKTINSVNNRISQNKFGNNAYIPIGLSSVVLTEINDGAMVASSSTTVSNLGMDYPVITSYSISAGSSVTLSGFVGNSAAGNAIFSGAEIQVYRMANDRSQNGNVSTTNSQNRPHGEGDLYLGTLKADALGRFSGTISTSLLVAGDAITAIAIDSATGSTSEFGVTTQCLAGSSAVILKGGITSFTANNACVTSTGSNFNLYSQIDSTAIPAGTTVLWFTISNPNLTSVPVSNPTTASPGTYYPFYYDAAGCFNTGTPPSITINAISTPTVSKTVEINTCPGTVVSLPVSGTQEWHTVDINPSGATKVSNPSNVVAGVYYLYNTNGSNCYSAPSPAVVAMIVSCNASIQTLTKKVVDPTNGSNISVVNPQSSTNQATVNYVMEISATRSNAPYTMLVSDSGLSSGQTLLGSSITLPTGWTKSVSGNTFTATAVSTNGSVMGNWQLTTIPPINGSAFTSTGGDGYNVRAYEKKVYQINHHNHGLHLECWDKATTQPCFNSTTNAFGTASPASPGRYLIPDGTTFNGQTYYNANSACNSSFWIDANEQYIYSSFIYQKGGTTSPTSRGVGIIKSEIGTGNVIDIEEMDSASASSSIYYYDNGGLTTPITGVVKSNNNLYFYSGRNGKLFCYDIATSAACSSQPPTVSWGTNAINSSSVHVNINLMQLADNKIVVGANGDGGQWALFDPATNTFTKGPTNFIGGDKKGYFALLNSSGINNGFCFYGVGYYGATCYDLNGNSLTPTQDLSPLLYWLKAHNYGSFLDNLNMNWDNVPAFAGKMYFNATVSRGLLYSSVYCYDFISGNTCTDWPKTTKANSDYLSRLNYTIAKDLSDPSCMWVSSDGAGVWSFNTNTGGACIKITGIANVAPAFCDKKNYSGRINWDSVMIEGLTPGSDYSSFSFTVLDSIGTAISGYTGLNITSSGVDISGITFPTYTVGGITYNTKKLTAVYSPVGLTNNGRVRINSGAAQVLITWNGDKTQICFQATTCAGNTQTISNSAKAQVINGGGLTSNIAAASINATVAAAQAPVPTANSISASCPNLFVNLNSLLPATPIGPTEVYEWHTVDSNPTAATLIGPSNANPRLQSPTQVSLAGTYYLYRKSNTSLCHSKSSAAVIVVINCNDLLALNDINQTMVNVSVGGNVLTNDKDPEGNVLSVNTIPLKNPIHGTVSLASNGDYTYTPNSGYSGNDSFQYSVCDNGSPGKCDTAMVYITIIPKPLAGNNPPVAINDNFATEMNTTVSGNLISNDYDPDGNTISINTTPVTPPSVLGGTLTINTNGTYTYIPPAWYTGIVQFSYSICDNGSPSKCDTALVTIDIQPDKGNATFAADDAGFGPKNKPISGNVISNDFDPESNTQTVNSIPISNPAHGTVLLNTNGSFTYSPNPGFTGNDAFIYAICDNGSPAACDTATVYLTLFDPNEIYAQNDINQTFVNTPVSGNVLTNDKDPEGNSMTVNTTPITNVKNGTVVLNSNGSYTYTPATNFTGNDSFQYQVCDNGIPSVCDTAWAYISVFSNLNINNNPPVAIPDNYSAEINTMVYGSLITNDFDPDGNTITINTTPIMGPSISGGTLIITSVGFFQYTPPANYVGQVTFSYSICDNGTPGLCDTTLVTIDILPDNGNATFASDDAGAGLINTPIIGNVLRNDYDPETNVQTLNTTPVVNALHGTVSLSINGSFTYTPSSGYVGNDQFIYQICDNGSPTACDTATVYLTVFDFPPVLIEGKVFHDFNGLTNSAIDGVGTGIAGSQQLWAYLINSGIVIDSTQILPNGNYSFDGGRINKNYTVLVSQARAAIGATAPSAVLAPNWQYTGESYGTNNASGAGIETGTPNGIINLQTGISAVSDVNFGIEYAAIAHQKDYLVHPDSVTGLTGLKTFTHFIRLNAGSGNADTTVNSVNIAIKPGKMSGFDAEDGRFNGNNLTTHPYMILTALPDTNNALLVYNYNGTNYMLYPNPSASSPAYRFWNPTSSRYQIDSFRADNMFIFLKLAYQINTTFTYAYRDAAQIVGAPATYNLNYTVPLSIFYRNFGCTPVAQSNQVQITLLNENATLSLELQRSSGNSPFTTISIQKTGNKNPSGTYLFIDANPLDGINTYRIKLVMTDGSILYTEACGQNKTYFDLTSGMIISPNPAHSFINCTVNKNITGLTRVILYDSKGNQVIQKSETLDEQSHSIQLPTTYIPDGVYTVAVENEGKWLYRKVIIRHH